MEIVPDLPADTATDLFADTVSTDTAASDADSTAPHEPEPGAHTPLPHETDGSHEPLSHEALQPGDVRFEYHPHSGRPTVIKSLDDYLEQRTAKPEDLDPQPWRHFDTLDNFEFAEWALDAELNERQVNKILKMIDRVRAGVSQLSFTSSGDLTRAWAVASETEHAVYPSSSYRFVL